MRVFLAIRPSDEAIDHLHAALDQVRADAGRALRWSDPEQWHVTLAFHPALPEGAVEDTLDEVASLAAGFPSLDLQLTGAGQFAGRTLWIGVGGESSGLQSMLAEPWLGEGDPEHRRAHLTVARVSARASEGRRGRRGRQQAPATALLDRTVRALSVYRGPTWRVGRLQLMSSRLGEGRSGGPLHEVIGAVNLG